MDVSEAAILAPRIRFTNLAPLTVIDSTENFAIPYDQTLLALDVDLAMLINSYLQKCVPTSS